jgi:single-stranded-DNA-specific exonuclease
MLMAFFRELGMSPQFYIPHRVQEGYGLNLHAVRRLAGEGLSLLITTDCGVSNHLEIGEAARLGIDTIVIDHHEIPDELPPAVAILNPKREDCAFPFDDLAGVGVAFQLLIALRAKLRERGFWRDAEPPNLRRYLDLVCLGTISDMVPVVDENRVLVRFGLEELSVGNRQGIQALKEASGLSTGTINCGRVAFQLAPRLNACGRLDHSSRAVELLLTDSLQKARDEATLLAELNSLRQKMEGQIHDEILEEIQRDPDLLDRSCLFFSSTDWHPGIIGIVASRLVERFHKPAFLISVNQDNLGRGSARGLEGMDLCSALRACQELLTALGGHRMAAGFTISSESIMDLRDALERVLTQQPDETDRESLWVDAEVGLADIDHRLLKDLALLEPHGMGNPRPLFLSRNLEVCDRRIVGSDSLKLRVKDGQIFDAIGFRMADAISLTNGPIDLVFTPQMNQWMGSERIELEVRELNPHLAE